MSHVTNVTPRALADFLREPLSTLLQGLVNEPKCIELKFTVSDTAIILEVNATSGDATAQLVGKRGRLAAAIRTLLNAYGGKHGITIAFKINEPAAAAG